METAEPGFTFEKWLDAQKHRDNLLGDFARELENTPIIKKRPRRKYSEHAIWADIVIEMTQPFFIQIFNEAWQAYEVEKSLLESVNAT